LLLLLFVILLHLSAILIPFPFPISFADPPDIDWENLDRSKPPSVPSASDLSSLAESRLGLFTNDSEYKRIVLTDDDHLLYENWDFGSRSCFEEEVVELLVCEEISVSESAYV
jgi:hypothetical protein